MLIKTKILLPIIALTLILTAAIIISNTALFSRFVDEATVEEVDVAAKVAIDSLESLKAQASAATMSIAEDPGILGALENGSREELLARARALQIEAGADFCTITDADGVVIARTHAPETYGDSLAYQANVHAAMYGESLSAVEEGSAIRLSARAGAPVVDGGGETVGVVSAGFRLDTGGFVDRLKGILGCEITVVLGDERIATTVLNEDGTRAIGTRADAHIKETVFAGNTYSGRVDILDRPTIANYVPIDGADGQPIGMIYVGQYFDEELATIQEFVQGGMIIVFVMLAVFITIILLITGRIVTPIQAMTKAASALALGDTDLDIQVNTKDEMRTLADAFNQMVENTRRQVQIVESIARGDAEVSIHERSDKDIMNRSLGKLNETIKAHAAAVREEHERTKLMLDATPLACRLWDRNYNLIECNELSVKLFGVKDKREYIERHFEFAPEYQPNGQTTREWSNIMIREAFDKGASRGEFMYRLPDGSPLPVDVTLVRVPYGDDYAVAAYSRDLREHVEMMAEIEAASNQLEAALQEAKRANNAKSDFLARMSHEMRTPLNAIIGLSEITLSGSGLNEETQSNLEKIYNSGSTLLSIVNDILDISKIQSGNFVILPKQYDFPSLVNDSILQNVLRIGSRPIRFNLEIDEDTPARLFGDELRIKQIINNLLSNAFKYTEEGTVALSLSCEREGDSVWMTIRVSDTGIGIREEHLSKLFADYTQFGATSYHQADGTGLGLAITQRLIEMMDGDISVKSEFGVGSVFTVKIRQGYIDDAVIGPAVAESLKRFDYSANKLNRNSRASRIPLPYARVLLVDDNITNLDVTKGLMKPYRMKVDCVTSGEAAVRAVRAEKVRYSAIFMDHMMPGMDGVEATRLIRQTGTEYAETVPIIALTANAIVGSEEMFLNNGFQAFISKPIDIMRLDAILRQWVRDKDQEQELSGWDEGATPVDGALRGPSLASINIAGVDKRKALERFGGDEEVYLDVLRSYAKGTRLILASLREYLAAENLNDYAIAVHGVKGSSYAICAREVGELAEALEMSAKAGEIGEVRGGHDAFDAAASALLDELDKALGDIGGEEKPLAAAPDTALLFELRSACEAFDMDRVDAALEQLEAFQYESGGELVAWLREQVNNMVFEEIVGMDFSSPGHGQAKAEASAEAKEAREANGDTARGAKLLVVEDNETNAKVIMGLLKPLGVSADLAENGREALRMIQAARYDLILMDYMMPVMDGIEATEALRSMEGEYYQSVPVVALTANEAPDAKENCLMAGMDDFISKPVEPKELRAVLRTFLPKGMLKETEADAPIAQGSIEERALPVIPGIDAREGVRYSGSRELFINLLGDFYKLIDLKAAKIEKCLAGGQIRDLTIEVHALKSTARMLGAMELSEGFNRLEQYGNAGDRDALIRETPQVLRQLRAFKPLLKPFGEMAEEERKPASKEALIALLQELKAAADAFDLDGADEALKRLEKCRLPARAEAGMEALRAYLADVAIAEVLKSAGAMIGIIENLPEDAI